MSFRVALNEIGFYFLDDFSKDGRIEIPSDSFGEFVRMVIEVQTEETFFFVHSKSLAQEKKGSLPLERYRKKR